MRSSSVILLLLQLVLLLITEALVAQPTTCQMQCGNIIIPYPFGIGQPSCFRPGFNLTCNESFPSGPKLFLGDGTIEVTKILLTEGQVLINNKIDLLYCSPGETIQDSKTISWTGLGENGPFTFSSTRNSFITISCGVISYVTSTPKFNASVVNLCATGCLSGSGNFRDGFCSGIGCCQTDIEASTYSLSVRIVSILNLTQPDGFGPCTKVFVVDREQFRFNKGQLTENFYHENSKVPVVLDWAIFLDDFCDYARSNQTTFACRSENSYCYNVLIGKGYRCNCSRGFVGNPYISNGCKDINECEQVINPCLPGECINTMGGYSCLCPKGTCTTHNGDHRFSYSPNKSPNHIGIIISIAGGAGFGLFILLLASYSLNGRLEKINIRKHREKCFHQNHGLLLQQLLTLTADDIERTKIFTLEELEKATNNFDVTRVLGRGGHGTVYKGILSDQRVVAIKKSEIVAQREIKQFINEVAILSQINHRNVVKLFGCCLEAEVPLLIYEFISGGTLSNHLHVIDNHVSSLSFEDRLRIATEIAGALAYLHSAASISIFHRDIKSSNILLDHNFTAKISDFGASRSIPTDKTRITTMVQGTFGYLDPEYYHTGQLTEKSDVYSFGVILVELLTGQRAVSHTLLQQEKNLAMHFIWSLKADRLFQILDARVAEEGTKKKLEAIASLAEMCLRLKGEERPTMKMVEENLNRLSKTKKPQKYDWRASQQQNFEEPESSITNTSGGSSANDETRLQSMENEFMMSLNFPR